MLTKKINYHLPKSLIAQNPVVPRDHSRLLVLNRESRKIIHDRFYNLNRYLRKGDVIVLNNTKVFPARLMGRREGKGRKIEVFLLKKIDEFSWNCLLGGKKRENVSEVQFKGSSLLAKIEKRNNDCTWRVKFNLKGNRFWQEVESIGQVPTPPYIKTHRKFDRVKKDFYQTIFAKEKGSVAAPTAGFHFTQKLVKELKSRGVKFVFVTLHVGLGTFAPIREKKVEEHRMDAEWFELNKNTADILNKAKKENRRIIAVGTTVTRVLENAAITSPSPDKSKCGVPRSSKSEAGSHPSKPNNYLLVPRSGETKKFIYPGYKFKFVDALITNFHLPHSTPLLLASAFIEDRRHPELVSGSNKGKKMLNQVQHDGEGIKILLEAYKEAIKKKYRFYSFGDAMLIY